MNTPPLVRPARWTDQLLSLPALSIRQPYALLVTQGIKDVENRSRRTHKREPILIHASLSDEYLTPEVAKMCEAICGFQLPKTYEFGGIIGVAEIVDCVPRHSSPWKLRGTWGWVLANARPLPFRACKGAVGFFYPFK